MIKEMAFKVICTCSTCKHLDWFDDEEGNDYMVCSLRCKSSNQRVNENDDCEKWELCEDLIKDTFWIKKQV